MSDLGSRPTGAGWSWLDPPITAAREVATRALAEDLGVLGDLTAGLMPADATVVAVLAARGDGVLAGRLAADEAFRAVDPAIAVQWEAADGDRLAPGTVVAVVRGALRSVLTAERTVLNLLGHLSGVATLTRRYVDAAGDACSIRDTRKTTPGLRALEKAAVRAGGGANHRGSLSEGILVKDNHLAGLGIADAVAAARRRWPGHPVEVECDDLEQVGAALAAGADLVLVDNMSPDAVAAAVRLVAGRAPVEVSGGVGLADVAAYAAAGADLIAVGALTHSAPVLDLGLDLSPGQGH
ncbi:MAG TPA: carboxylating nicotinate-nucleotide diphosphorylase [Acidimicrobiales bacterium]|jgi:nicotinate-nucleotide pyrophosphorylase (carboxylating)|nr:carboxylating nicotinate-nucleotide diphosphorylase [Acidimicrobiales bacterium]